MERLQHLFDNNRAWAASVVARDPEFFKRLANSQSPPYLWIGCSDSRVPANEIVGLPPGGMFVHRNVANLVVHSDLNCLSTIQFAVDVLKVSDIIVCGHYGCGGVRAALLDQSHGLVDNWLRHLQDVHWKYRDELDAIEDVNDRVRRFGELNVVEQVVNVSNTTVVRDAWERGDSLAIHGWIYDVADGLLNDLRMCVTNEGEVPRR